MANLNTDTANNIFYTNHTVANSGTYNYILDTENKFVDKKVKISFYTPAATINSGSASVTSTMDSTTGTNAINIHGVLSTTASRPTAATAYYISLNLTGTGNSSIDTDGWITTATSLPSSSTNTTAFYTIQKASGSVTHNAAVSTTVTISTGNVSTTSNNNGIYILSSGSSTASGSITANIDTAGYIPFGSMATESINKNTTTSTTTYINGVIVPNTTFTVTAATNKQGTIKIAAYSTSSASSRDALLTVVTNGVWTTTSIKPTTNNQGPFYGKVSIESVTSSNLTAANIKYNVNVKVIGGDTDIYSITGTFTSSSSVSAGQIAALAGQMLSGYSAWVNGQEVKGNITNRGTLNETITTLNGTVTITAGYYTGGTITATLPTTTVTSNTWSINASSIISTTYANWNAGYIATSGNIPAVQFLNEPATGSTSNNYLDLTNAKKDSSTYYIPEVNNSRYIYITKGYIDNVKIDIGRLIPDITGTPVGAEAANYILSGHYAYDQDGKLLSGSISDIIFPTGAVGTASGTSKGTVYVKTTDLYVIIPAGYNASTIYYKFNKTTTSNYSSANIRSGKTITVSNGNENIYSVAGTFSAANTVTSVTSGVTVTAASAASIRSGYSAFLNGAQLDGTMPTVTASTTYTATNIGTYFNPAASNATTGSIAIVPQHSVSTGYIEAVTNQEGIKLFYNIKMATFKAGTGNAVLVSDTAAKSIYATSNTRNITINDNAPTDSNRVYIKVTGSGTVSSSAAGWINENTATGQTGSKTRYISLDYYTGEYQTTEELV